MENFIKIETQHSCHETELIIDNSTDYKDFRIKRTGKDKIEKKLDIQISQATFTNGEKGVVTLEIGEVALFGREVELLKEFLNQL